MLMTIFSSDCGLKADVKDYPQVNVRSQLSKSITNLTSYIHHIAFKL